tara:strand:+ start:72 stop:908 length:837 start_codon:yes stop_codon:yes gene_type:complete
MKYYISLLILVSFISCAKDDSSNTTNIGQTENDIIKYIDENNLDASRTSNGVYYIIKEQGIGDNLELDAYAKLIYKGYLLDGTEFNKSASEGTDIDLLYLIPGFSEGLTKFNTGSKGTIIIPPQLAYGDSGSVSGIPAGAVLVIDIEVISISNPQTEDDIIAYLSENNLEAERSNTGLYYIIEEQGSGEAIPSNSNVTVAYKGYLLNGTVFDSSTSGVKFDLSKLIKGFAEGITYFNVGGKGTLILPPNLGYGSSGISGTIPRNAVLFFDIDIKSLNN